MTIKKKRFLKPWIKIVFETMIIVNDLDVLQRHNSICSPSREIDGYKIK